MSNILIFSPTPSHPQNAGNRKRIYNVAKYLKSLGNKIHFVYFTQEGLYSQQQNDMQKEWDSLTIIKKEIEYTLNGDGYYLADDWYQDNIGSIVQQKCIEYNIQIILVINLFQSKLLEYLPSHMLKLIDAQEKFTNRHIMLKESGIKPDYYYTIESEEKIALERADKILAIQDKEAEFFKTILSKPVEVLNHIEISQILDRKYSTLNKLGFIGSGNSINLKSMNEFINKFITFIENNKFDITLEIAGSICNKLDIDHKNINLLGFVDSEKDFYSNVDLIINPLITGTGLKIKSVEALSFGVPIISTKIGFDGLKSDLKLHDLDSIDEMLYEIEKIYNNTLILDELSQKSIEIFNIYEKEMLNITNTVFSNEYYTTLLVTDIEFWKADLGNRQRILRLIQYLKNKVSLKVLVLKKFTEQDILELKKYNLFDIVDCIYHSDDRTSDINKYKDFYTVNLEKFYNLNLKVRFDNYLKKNNFNNIIIEYIRLDYLLNGLDNSNFNTIIDTHDLMSIRTEKHLKNGEDFFINLKREEEYSILSKYDNILAIQKSEYKLLQENIKNSNIILSQHAVNICFDRIINKNFKNITFVSGPANAQFIEWFIKNVWTIFFSTDLVLNIFGSCCDRLENYTSYKNIVLHGRIDNLSIAYDNSDLVINPVLFGGGLKIKNVEALANGLPLITTNEGANGIEDGINKSFLLANTVNEWIDSILSLMLSSSLREQLSKNALEYAKNNFSDDICYGELVKKIKDNT